MESPNSPDSNHEHEIHDEITKDDSRYGIRDDTIEIIDEYLDGWTIPDEVISPNKIAKGVNTNHNTARAYLRDKVPRTIPNVDRQDIRTQVKHVKDDWAYIERINDEPIIYVKGRFENLQKTKAALQQKGFRAGLRSHRKGRRHRRFKRLSGRSKLVRETEWILPPE